MSNGKALAVGAIGASTAALIVALSKPAKATPPTDEEIRQALAVILGHQVEILGDTQDIKTAISQLPGGEEIMPTKIELMSFSYTLTIAGTPTSGVLLTELAPFDGYIKQVSIHWPDGCNALVGVRVGYDTTQFCPREGFLALNNATVPYPFNVRVEVGKTIWVEMRNTDGANPHNITVTVMVEGEA